MVTLRERIKGRPLHGRSIDMKTYVLDDDTILVEGRLQEDRFHTVFDITGESKAPGPVHHMTIWLMLGGTPLAILDADAEMSHAPLAFCQVTLETVQKVIGLEIAAGFQKRVRALMGGDKGCAHLTHLLTVMSQAAFQGQIAHRRRHRTPVPRSMEEVVGLGSLLGSCRAWREDGPKVKNLKAAIKKQRR